MHPQEIVDRALELSRSGLTDREVALKCGISVGALRHWRRGDRRAPDGRDRVTKAQCPRCHDRPLDGRAYAYLFGLYLGDGHIVRTGNRGVYRLEIYCDDGWPGIAAETAQAIAAVMPGLKVGRRQHQGCSGVGAYSKHWPCVFPQHGPGMKHTRRIALVEWQQAIVEEHAREFVRGLIHSDGCRCINRVRRPLKDGDRWYEYPRYLFKNASDDIRRLYTDALDRLGIAWKQNNVREISVARRDAVARLDEFVGPKY
ncbi:helix-turn-helix domain-containing protein [Thermomonospora cellulosilytica]|uniref:DOD-type homing endonuclease domain-containing protein n=1 Tax=Thermomonospora cellulosilytica TaxID=1411118 RepID=A0A7W3N2N4_9ACTN|nr:helix-turn-helix domain-containing protein [Thermomonospora cellulosilytica]MBA9006430.1 hypothetical protein [Thermomonospora cellulosilytica]